MLKTKSKILLSIFLVLILVSSCCFATAETQTSEDSENGEAVVTSDDEGEAIVTEDEDSDWTNSDLYVSKDTVTISNVVDGNAFVIGKEVTITGEIGGDLFVIADKLTIEGGYIYSSIFACANEITINGVIYDVYAACNTFNLESNGFIYRDMKVTASNVNINGRIRRDAYISANTITFDETAGTLIYGDLNYTSSSEIVVPEGIVSGDVKYTVENQETSTNTSNIVLSYVLNLLQSLVYTFVVTLLLLWLTPKFVERVGNMNVAKSFASLGIGFAAPIVLAFAAILLLITSIGSSVALSGIFAFTILAFMGKTIASIFFGKLFTKLLKMNGNVKFVLFTLVSSLIIWVISKIPVIGGFFGFIISIFGIGTILVNMVWKKEASEETKSEVKE